MDGYRHACAVPTGPSRSVGQSCFADSIKDRRGKFDSATHSEVDELSVIADECTLKPGVEIINSVLGKGCYIEERVRIENSVI